MIIFGIIARMPTGAISYQTYLQNLSASDWWKGALIVLVVVIAVLIIVTFVTWVQQADRKIPIQYTRRVSGDPDSSYLPLKVNVAGVIPVIFASSFIATPQTVLMAFANNHSEDTWYQVLTDVFNMQTTSGTILYTILIILFTFFYAFVQVNPENYLRTYRNKAVIFLVSGLVMKLKFTYQTY